MSQELTADMNQSTIESNLRLGYRFRSGREAKQLSQEKVATQLRLSSSQIEAIETDNYTYAAPVYVRGHLMMYARLLGLPLEEILQNFTQLQAEHLARPQHEAPAFAEEKIKFEHSWSDNTHKIRWLGIGVLVIVALVAAIGWVSHVQEKHQARNTIAVSPGDGGTISQINNESVTVPSTLAPQNSPSKANKTNNVSKNSNANTTKKDHQPTEALRSDSDL
jgi:cytoskeletal protein RodZ